MHLNIKKIKYYYWVQNQWTHLKYQWITFVNFFKSVTHQSINLSEWFLYLTLFIASLTHLSHTLLHFAVSILKLSSGGNVIKLNSK